MKGGGTSGFEISAEIQIAYFFSFLILFPKTWF